MPQHSPLPHDSYAITGAELQQLANVLGEVPARLSFDAIALLRLIRAERKILLADPAGTPDDPAGG